MNHYLTNGEIQGHVPLREKPLVSECDFKLIAPRSADCNSERQVSDYQTSMNDRHPIDIHIYNKSSHVGIEACHTRLSECPSHRLQTHSTTTQGSIDLHSLLNHKQRYIGCSMLSNNYTHSFKLPKLLIIFI